MSISQIGLQQSREHSNELQLVLPEWEVSGNR